VKRDGARVAITYRRLGLLGRVGFAEEMRKGDSHARDRGLVAGRLVLVRFIIRRGRQANFLVDQRLVYLDHRTFWLVSESHVDCFSVG